MYWAGMAPVWLKPRLAGNEPPREFPTGSLGDRDSGAEWQMADYRLPPISG